MTQNQHTPGPWNVRYSEDRADAFIECGDRSNITDWAARFIAQTYVHDLEDAANARLIAAAPDLLAALQNVIYGWDNWAEQGNIEHAIDAARAAIAKATGV